MYIQLLLIFGVRVYRNEPGKRDLAIAMLSLGSLSKVLSLSLSLPHVSFEEEALTFKYTTLPAVFIPGIWSTYILYGALRRWKGFNYRQVPSYENVNFF